MNDDPHSSNAFTEHREKFIVPLERMALTPDLDGSAVWAKPNSMFDSSGIKTDVEAVQNWLAGYKGESMRKGCLRAIEKLMLWCVVERGHALAEFSGAELPALCQFLMAPDPPERWLGAHAVHRSQPKWRPFRKAMSVRLITQLLILCNVYFRWAEASGLEMPGRPYVAIHRLLSNPESLYHRGTKLWTMPRVDLEAWIGLRQFFPDKNESFLALQQVAALQMLFYGGITVKHLLSLTRGDFKPHDCAQGGVAAWEFPTGKKDNFTVFSVGPLTSTITQLLAHPAVCDGGEEIAQKLFVISENSVRQSLARARIPAVKHLVSLGQPQLVKAVSQLTLVHLRGGLIRALERQSAPVDVASVFATIFLAAYPRTSQYFDFNKLADPARYLEALEITKWVSKIELAITESFLSRQGTGVKGGSR